VIELKDITQDNTIA